MTSCKVCKHPTMEPKTIDRLLTIGYGPQFIASRWGLPRHHVKRHRDVCLTYEKRQAILEELKGMVMEKEKVPSP